MTKLGQKVASFPVRLAAKNGAQELACVAAPATCGVNTSTDSDSGQE